MYRKLMKNGYTAHHTDNIERKYIYVNETIAVIGI